jgi:hypothetical protein
VGVTRHDQRKATHPRTIERRLRQQRRVGSDLVEVFEDRQRLEQQAAIVVDQRRQHHLRIDGAKLRIALLALQ